MSFGEVLSDSSKKGYYKAFQPQLVYALKWYAEAPMELHQLVTAEDYDDKSWFTAVRHGIAWMATMSQSEIDCTPTCTATTMEWLHNHIPKGAAQVRNAVKRYLLQQQTVYAVLAGHRKIWDICIKAGRQLHRGVADEKEGQNGIYPCNQCLRTFPTAQALQGHQWSWHHQCSDERLYVFSDTCPICHTCYWTSQRMQQHLKATKHDPNGCFAQMVRFYEPLSAPVQFQKPVEVARFHRLPRCRVEGPVNQRILPVWRQRQQQRLDEYDQRWAIYDFPTTLCPDFVEEQGARYSVITEQWQQQGELEKEDLMEQWHLVSATQTEFKTAIMAFLHWGRYSLHNVIDQWDDPVAIQTVITAFEEISSAIPIWQIWIERDAVCNWRAPPQVMPPRQERKVAAARGAREVIPNSLGDQDVILAPFANSWAMPSTDARQVPVFETATGERYVVILHLFSGRRRQLDCGHWAIHFGQRYFAQHGIQVMMLAIDTAVHPQLGDLAQGPSLEAMMALAEIGIFALGLGGPPCETWSAARHLELENGGGPRPLRSRLQPWGIPYRTARELRQLAMGSQLMMTELTLETLIVTSGGDTLMEHPEEPVNPDYASIWRVGLHQHLLPSLVPMTAHHVQQWRHGAVSVKPTCIRTMGMQKSYHIFQRNETPNVQKPDSVLGGVDEAGRFKTARAKEYPADFCKALIDVSLSNLARRYDRHGPKLVQEHAISVKDRNWLYQMWAASTEINPGANWLPDYQPR